MADIGIFFGSDDGNTQSIAHRIAQRFGEDNVDIHDISDVTHLTFMDYSHLILGIPTWDFGQIQSDWEDFWADLETVNFAGRAVAFVGLGDQFGYGDFFLDAMGMLHDVVIKTADSVVGYWPTDDYEFDASKAEIPGKGLFVGLGIDEDQQPEMTADRLNRWCKQVHQAWELSGEIIELDD